MAGVRAGRNCPWKGKARRLVAVKTGKLAPSAEGHFRPALVSIGYKTGVLCQPVLA